jgi:hypothetical protein
MRLYRVYIIDTLTMWPLAYHEVHAWTKWGAKRKIFKWVYEKDKNYFLIASRTK